MRVPTVDAAFTGASDRQLARPVSNNADILPLALSLARLLSCWILQLSRTPSRRSRSGLCSFTNTALDKTSSAKRVGHPEQEASAECPDDGNWLPPSFHALYSSDTDTNTDRSQLDAAAESRQSTKDSLARPTAADRQHGAAYHGWVSGDVGGIERGRSGSK